MRFCKSDAIKDPECCKKCHDSFTRGHDGGRPTLVHENVLACVEEQVMKKANSSLTLDILRQVEKAGEKVIVCGLETPHHEKKGMRW